jgi:NAD(P)-dependent dehydrogenase (short-subunit alcohol dehydrogenase family)
MKLAGKRVVITGGASGIGRAIADRFGQAGARVITADIQGPCGIRCDVSREEDLAALIEETDPIDLFVSNAGIGVDGGPEVPDADWDRIWRINTMAHVWAARYALPGMLARGHGGFLQVISAAGLLTQIGSAPYSVTKHAALAFAEWLSISYGDRGIEVFALCPQGVRTPLLEQAAASGSGAFLLEGSISAEACAEAAFEGVEAGRFLILPHPDVARYFQNKAQDYDRWLRGMRRLQDASGIGRLLKL